MNNKATLSYVYVTLYIRRTTSWTIRYHPVSVHLSYKKHVMYPCIKHTKNRNIIQNVCYDKWCTGTVIVTTVIPLNVIHSMYTVFYSFCLLRMTQKVKCSSRKGEVHHVRTQYCIRDMVVCSGLYFTGITLNFCYPYRVFALYGKVTLKRIGSIL